MLVRYIIKADGEIKDFTFDESKAWVIAHKYEYECANQDIPCFPIMTVEKEVTE